MFSFLRRRARPAIEHLRIEHAAECARMHAEFFAHPWSVSEFESMIASPNVFGAAAVDPAGRKPSGFILTRQAADEAEILTIAVDRALQKKGVGRELLEYQIAELRRNGVHKLFLEVDEGNKAARALYDRLRFVQVGTRPGYYRSASGAPANALILSCDLSK